MIYTSGSTGRPKGVVVEHRSVVDLAAWAATEFGAAGLSRVVASTSLNFDVSVFEIFCPLVVGGTHRGGARPVGARPSGRPAAVAAEPDQRGSVGVLPAARPGRGAGHRGHVVLAGEALPAQAGAGDPGGAAGQQGRQHLRSDRGDGVRHRLVRRTTATRDQAAAHRAPRSPTPRAYVLDASLRPHPGRRVRRAAPRRARPGPRLPEPAGADRRAVRRRPVRRAGRADVPHRRRGAVERRRRAGVPGPAGPPGEDPRLPHRARRDRGRAAAATTTVAEAVAVVRQAESGHKRLVAYVVPAPGTGRRRRVAARVPEPDAARLHGPVGVRRPRRVAAATPTASWTAPRCRRRTSAPRPRPATLAPRTDAERRSPQVWAEVLGLERVGVEDNFFELGGDSILSIQVVSRARQAGLRLAVEGPVPAPDHRRRWRRT